ncbi:hypothetical protein [Cytobacillus praedii]|uniref:hypothetical protein n=1 Tax=Cytobacillus praedii TaxID=1742358 RepID=UPI002E2506A3|nr:hypothetical protein [Cytobacillus praedii]
MENKKQFIERYDSLITDNVRQSIAEQAPAAMFANDLGVMVREGDIWFAVEPGDKYGISVIYTMPES